MLVVITPSYDVSTTVPVFIIISVCLPSPVDCLGQKPTLKEVRDYVVPHVSSGKWEYLGIELDLDDDGTLVDHIRKERGGDEAKCCLDVLKAWLQGKGVEPKTWRTLVGCLRKIEAKEAVRSIEENILQTSECM